MNPSGEMRVGKAETLLQVKDAEAKAKAIIEQAEEKQKQIVAAARRDALNKIQQAEQDLKVKNETAISIERKALTSQREQLMKKGHDEATHLGTKAKERIPKAKTYIKQQFERTLDAATGANE